MMRTYKARLVILIALLTLLAGCSKKNGPGNDLPDYKWTILCYFNGNNSEDQTPEGRSYVIQDVQELEQIGSTDQVQVVAMLGSFKTEGNCKYHHVEYHPNESPNVISSPVLLDVGKKDMSDPSTLRDFIRYGVENYWSERYMLIISDHGGGWKGFCSDAINGDGNWMTLPELSSALSGFDFNVIWLYAPSMSSLEVGYQLRDRGDYLLASQFDSYPTNIMGSGVWLADLTSNPDMKSVVFAIEVAKEVYEAAQEISEDKHVHSALIDLSGMAQVAQDASDLGEALVSGAGAFWGDVWDAWSASHNYEELDSATVDLRKFAVQIQGKTNLNLIIRSDAEDLDASIHQAVVAQHMHPQWYSIGGLSIHFPWNQADFDSLDYAWLDLAETDWDSFLSTFIQSFSGNYSASLQISSSPTGAKVFLNEVDTGYETNALITNILPGSYTIRLTKTGYKDVFQGNVILVPGQTYLFHAILVPSP
jgi:hypothetical protein